MEFVFSQASSAPLDTLCIMVILAYWMHKYVMAMTS